MEMRSAIQELLLRPDHIAILSADRMFVLSKTGALVDPSNPKTRFWTRAQDILAGTWRVLSPEQLMAEGAELAAQVEQQHQTS